MQIIFLKASFADIHLPNLLPDQGEWSELMPGETSTTFAISSGIVDPGRLRFAVRFTMKQLAEMRRQICR